MNIIVFNATLSVVENKVNQLRENGNNEEANELESKLNDIKNEFSEVQRERKTLLYKQNMLLNGLDNMSVPILPSTIDYKNPDGSVDEAGYAKAMAEYEFAQKEYDINTNEIYQQLDRIYEEIQFLDEKIIEIQEKIADMV